MPLTVFEAYYYDNELNGYPASHWDAVIEEYYEIAEDSGAIDMRMKVGEHTRLVEHLVMLHGALDCMANLYNEGIFARTLAEELRLHFRGVKFTLETLPKDIELCRSKLKTQERQLKEIEDVLPKQEDGEQKTDKSYFDNILQAYEITFSVPVIKESLTVQQFAIKYKTLIERIDKERSKNTVDTDG